MSRKRPKVYKWYTKEVKEPFKQSLTNLQKSTKEGGPKSQTPWPTPIGYKGKKIYTVEPNDPHFQKSYCFFPSKLS